MIRKRFYMKSVKAFGFFAMILAITATAFGVFLENSSGELNDVLNIGGTGVEAMGLLFVPIGLLFLYNAFR